jgi:hypothetical protein
MGPTVILSGVASAAAGSAGRSIIYFLGRTDTVSSLPSAHQYEVFSWASTLSSSSSNTSVSIPREDFVQWGFQRGSTVHIVAYGASTYSQSYLDTATGRLTYVGLSAVPSNVVTVTVP